MVIPHKRPITPLGAKRAPALGNCSCIALIPYFHVSIRVAAVKAPLVVAYTDVGKGR